jgi:spore germination protein KA
LLITTTGRIRNTGGIKINNLYGQHKEFRRVTMNENVLQYIKETFHNSFDVKYREIITDKGVITIVYIDNMCDSKFINEFIIKPLAECRKDIGDLLEFKKGVLSIVSGAVIKNKEELITNILSGNVVIISSFTHEVIYYEAKGFNKRGIEIPITEAVLKGPREGFNEAIADALSLVRKRVKDPKLKFENLTIGSKTRTTVVMGYIEGSAPKGLVDYIRSQLKCIETEALLDVNYIEEKLKCKNTPFDTIGFTEKPDVVASRLCEGRVAIFVDGTPFVVTAPYFFFENFQTGDDYYTNIFNANGGRILRWVAFGLATLLTGFYLAIVTHHFSLIPYMFTFRLAVSRAGVPFPTVVEVHLLNLFFQLSREAGVRLPQPIGQTMSIVGALILGDATVGSGLASQTSLIIVAISAICSFLVPKAYAAITYWNFLITIFSSVLGLPGFYISFCLLVSHIAGLNSCGYPYLFPLGTLRKYNHNDIITTGYLKNISNNIFDEENSDEKSS